MLAASSEWTIEYSMAVEEKRCSCGILSQCGMMSQCGMRHSCCSARAVVVNQHRRVQPDSDLSGILQRARRDGGREPCLLAKRLVSTRGECISLRVRIKA